MDEMPLNDQDIKRLSQDKESLSALSKKIAFGTVLLITLTLSFGIYFGNEAAIYGLLLAVPMLIYTVFKVLKPLRSLKADLRYGFKKDHSLKVLKIERFKEELKVILENGIEVYDFELEDAKIDYEIIELGHEIHVQYTPTGKYVLSVINDQIAQ